MSNPQEPARQQLKDAGIDEAHHDQALALRAPIEQRGVNWSSLLSVLQKLGTEAPALLEILSRLAGGPGGGATPAATTQAAPPKK